jgi:hypothetical protein
MASVTFFLFSLLSFFFMACIPSIIVDNGHMLNESKACSKCGETKELDMFRKQKAGKFGHTAACLRCESAAGKLWRAANPSYYADYQAKDPERFRLYKAAWKKANPKKHGISAEKYKAKYPERVLARSKANKAIEAGKLVSQPCYVCGTDQLIHAHHEDYSKPLDVLWLCRKHHHVRHKIIKLETHVN